MKYDSEISEQQLNAFIDDQLDAEERAQILEATKNNPQLAKQLNELRDTKELIKFAYREPPMPDDFNLPTSKHYTNIFPQSIAAGILLLFGVFTGWTAQTMFSPATENGSKFESVTHFDASNEDITRVILHISTLNKERVEAALNTTEQILEYNQNNSHKVQLEVIANADGLSILREGSPFTQRVSHIVNKYKNASFLACGVAMENAKLKEGTEIQLIPAAKKIPAALDRILTRLEQGWMYIKG